MLLYQVHDAQFVDLNVFSAKGGGILIIATAVSFTIRLFTKWHYLFQFGGDSSYLSSMNNYIRESHEKFK